MAEGPSFPKLRQVVLDTTDARALAEFYRQLLGLTYRLGDEVPDRADRPDRDWLVLRGADIEIAFQRVDELPPATWPDGPRPQMLHLDLTVPSREALGEQHSRVLELGGTMLLDRSEDPDERLGVYADPSGHPFCVFVG
jgi:catechol 2,3-dioxygenase-like lactoylglutathione lyase family enzyme